MTVHLTAEQKRILQTVKKESPHQQRTSGKLVLVTAGAGTGKTTTLLELAAEYARVNPHFNVTYLTFNKSAAQDGRRRLQEKVKDLDARTLHSCAMALLAKQRLEKATEEDIEKKILNDDQLQSILERIADSDIDDFLQSAYRKIHQEGRQYNHAASKIENRKREAREQVLFFLFKTLSQFCHRDMTLETLRDHRSRDAWKRHYFPAKKFHKGHGLHKGFTTVCYGNKVGWYADTIAKYWDELATIRTFDLEMKRAQLRNLAIAGDVILADECQDMDECQIAFLTHQISLGKIVYFVGDAAQTIYSFRGAKSEYLLNLQIPCQNFSLTRSFRFGPRIANIANVVLFAKENSPQTQKEKKSWHPYRLMGGGSVTGYVTSEPFDHEKCGPITIIAFANATLLLEALKVIGLPLNDDDDDENADNGIGHRFPMKVPKFHVNGRGESSGSKRWSTTIKQVEELYDLFSQRNEVQSVMALSKKLFPEFRGEAMHWNDFVTKCQDRELTKYAAAMQILHACKHRTIRAIELFQTYVLEQKYSADEADVILTTCHAAKGMEWDRVQVCNDFLELEEIEYKGPPVPGPSCYESPANRKRKYDHAAYPIPRRMGPPIRPARWRFKLKSWGDEANLLYVACTRAKQVLCIPPSLLRFLEECDSVHSFIRSEGTGCGDSGSLCCLGERLSLSTAGNVHQDLVLPLRAEVDIMNQDATLVSGLLHPVESSSESATLPVVTPSTDERNVSQSNNQGSWDDESRARRTLF